MKVIDEKVERNFRILELKISGMSNVKIAKEFGLTPETIKNVLKRQLKKIALYDHEFERLLSGHQNQLRICEDHCDQLANNCGVITKQSDFFRRELSLQRKENENLMQEAKSLRKITKNTIDAFNVLQKSMETTSTLKYTQEYQNVVENISKYKSSH